MTLHIVKHPLVGHKLGLMRRSDTSSGEFRRLAREIASLLTYEATRDLPLCRTLVKGWAGPVEVEQISGKMVSLVPILRAGLGLMEGVLDMIPGAKISVIGLYRDEETLQPVEYYAKPANSLDQRPALILDPMLATGGSLSAAVAYLKKQGCRHIRALTLVAAPEGVRAVESAHPEVDIYTAALDDGLNEKGYILPGLGDAGDRLFGTE